ncbi:hypothetical protein JCM5350_004370 [Sporobolomyces pararoseus]
MARNRACHVCGKSNWPRGRSLKTHRRHCQRKATQRQQAENSSDSPSSDSEEAEDSDADWSAEDDDDEVPPLPGPTRRTALRYPLSKRPRSRSPSPDLRSRTPSPVAALDEPDLPEAQVVNGARDLNGSRENMEIGEQQDGMVYSAEENGEPDLDLGGFDAGNFYDGGDAIIDEEIPDLRERSPTPPALSRSPTPPAPAPAQAILNNTVEIRYLDPNKPPRFIPPDERGNPVYPVQKPSSPRVADIDVVYPFGPHPWSPFPSAADLEAAIIPVEANLTDEHVKLLYKQHMAGSIHVADGEIDTQTGRSLRTLLNDADQTPFKMETISATSNGKTWSVNMSCIDPFDYLQALISDAYASPWIHWTSERWILHKGGRELEVRGEGYTGNLACETETAASLDNDLETLNFTLFTDETGAATYDSQSKIHSVIIWCTSIPQQARVKGTRAAPTLVALYPTSAIKALDGFQNEKEAQYIRQQLKEKSRRVVLEKFRPLLTHGAKFTDCFNVERDVRLVISQLSLDGKEAWAELGVRAHPGYRHCTVCFESSEESDFVDLTKTDVDYRTPEKTRDAYTLIRRARKDIEQKEIGNQFGINGTDLYPLASIPNTDCFRCLAFDALHTTDHGVSGDHAIPLAIQEVQRFGKETAGITIGDATRLFDQRCRTRQGFPGMPNLNVDVSSLNFSDGNKFLLIGRIAPAYLSDLLPQDCRKWILRILRSLAIIRLIIDSNFIPEDRIEELQSEIEELSNAGNALARWDRERFEDEEAVIPGADWYRDKAFKLNFSKWHHMKHLDRQVLDQGSPSHGDTRNGDGQHPLLKKLWRLTSHNGDFNRQLLEAYNRQRTFSLAQDALNRYEEARTVKVVEETEDEPEAFPIPTYDKPVLSVPDLRYGGITVGQLSKSYQSLRLEFRGIENKLRRFASDFIVARDGNLIPDDAPYSALAVVEDCLISPCQCATLSFFDPKVCGPVSYRMRLVEDVKNHSVLIRRDGAYVVGQVMKFFTLEFENTKFDLVLVRIGNIQEERDDSGFPVVKWLPPSQSNFFFLHEIERPVLVQERESIKGQKLPSLLNDLVDLELRDILKVVCQ